MRQFTAAAIACIGAASAQYGSTGHWGNQYGHAGRQDHDHADHHYGYDSIPSQKYLKTGTGLTNNEAKRDSAILAVTAANDDRIAGLEKEKEKREARLDEIHSTRKIEIEAPFTYQLSLLEKELADVSDAYGEATLDLGLAQADMLLRLDNLFDDKVEGL